MMERSVEKKWYLLASKPKQEERAVENLLNQSINAFTPKIKVEKLKQGRKIIKDEPLFMGYLFVQLSTQDPNWHKIRSTRGVRDWVRFSGVPATLNNKTVEAFIETTQSDNNSVQELMNKGDKVQIESGPFKGLSGIFECNDGEMRSMILIEFLGSTSRISIENEQISNN